MSSQIYNWKRFWCPREASFSLSDGGYLSDPEAEWGPLYNPHVKPFEAIAETPCLILLGEPGIGKTRAIEAEWRAREAKTEQEEEETLWFDLRSYGDEGRLVRNLFESGKFLAWTEGAHQLHLFLDSLDEGLLRIDTLAALLAEELTKHQKHSNRLLLRIACRTAEWPSSLEAELRSLWGEQPVRVYELVPLRRVDVIEAARVNNIEPKSFLSEIERAAAVPFAIKPVTLNFLLRIYQQHGNFPKTQADLYLEGCRLLCEATEGRRGTRLKGNLSADQRLAVAARIAAVSIFAKRSFVWTTIDQGDVPEEAVTIRELSGESEQIRGNAFEVGEHAIEETLLNTGLFSSRGLNGLGWAHQTYAEFLAAHYLAQHQMTLAQMMSLIVHPGDAEKKLVPQLYETAAWLASLAPEVFREIMKSDPEVLLRSDVATAEEADRAALVQALLEKCDAESSLLYHDWGVFAWFKKLAHGGLPEQLRAYICDSAKGQLARSVAINIARACRLQTLENELAHLALDQAQPLKIREDAARAVAHSGTAEARAQLKPLALGGAGDDPGDELKGVGLQAIWPDHLSAEELFTLLTPPKNENFMGAYEEFLSRNLATKIRPADLPVALNWVAAQSHYNPRYQFKRLVDAIMLRAWEQIGAPGVLQSFANAALSELKHHNEILRDRSDPQSKSALLSHEAKRWQVLETMLEMLSESGEDLGILFSHRAQLVFPKDIPWMISRLQAVASEGIQRAWAWLIERMFNRSDLSQTDTILVACQNNPILAEACTWLLKPIEMNSPEAQKARENYREEQLWQEQHDKGKPILDPPSAQRIAALLGQCESGKLEAWRLPIATMAESIYKSEYETDLTTLPGWTAADDEIRERIVAAAEQYVMERGSKTQEQPDTSTLFSPVVAAAGYKALLLILQRDRNFLSTIPREIWRKWAPIILTYPLANGTPFKKPSRKKSEQEESTEAGARFEEEQLQLTLITQAYQYAPEEIVQTLLLLIDEQNEQHGDIFILSRIERCWNDYLKNVLLVKMKDEKLCPKSLGRLLGMLLDQGTEEARNFAETVIRLSSVDDVNQRDRAITAACMLMIHTADAGWLIVWPAIQQDVEFGREVLSSHAFEADVGRTNIAGRLMEEQLADLYLWLVRQYPYSEDSNHEDDYVVGPRERAVELRDSLLRQLKTRGTPQACAAIRRIVKELPELDWLKWTLLEAQAITRRQTWQPPSPQDILAITSSQQKRLVQSGEQLLDVLAESLQRLEKDLQGETPQVEFLWNRPSGICRPKDENAFSNYVKSHLEKDIKQRGIFANREVEFRRNMGGNPGERVDIQVDAVSKRAGTEEYDRISAVIEVKGCWHEELNHAMQTQLVDRYLNEAHCQHGLYLVGWFNCKQWDKEDYRRGQAPKIDIEEARKQFDAQAKELSQAGLEIRTFVMNTALR